MAIDDKEIRFIPASHGGLARPAVEDPHELFPDVRLTVESQFRQMDRAHERIRSKELAARLATHMLAKTVGSDPAL